MIKVPEALQKKFNRLLMNSDIALDKYGIVINGSGYYLDF
jgi:hypothetical protein